MERAELPVQEQNVEMPWCHIALQRAERRVGVGREQERVPFGCARGEASEKPLRLST